jgi:hypothetical protein
VTHCTTGGQIDRRRYHFEHRRSAQTRVMRRGSFTMRTVRTMQRVSLFIDDTCEEQARGQT